jgi:hypothetical protein
MTSDTPLPRLMTIDDAAVTHDAHDTFPVQAPCALSTSLIVTFSTYLSLVREVRHVRHASWRRTHGRPFMVRSPRIHPSCSSTAEIRR